MKLNISFSIRPDLRSSLGLRALLLGGIALFALLPRSHAQRMTLAEPDVAPVTVETAAVSTEVTGRVAVTTFDLVFRNPNSRPLEGTFEFPLLEGQSVIRFALDIGGVLREAVPVEKETGRVAFEEIERRRVDPGLLEQTEGNNYRARIFPLPAQGTRRIVIAYQEELARDREGGATYRLPLDFPARLPRFDLAVAVRAGEQAPPRASTTLALELPEWSVDRVLRIFRNDFLARGVLELALPRSEAPALLTQKLGGREYFSVEVPLAAMPVATRPMPKVVGILWDASGSGRNREHAREYSFLDAWFREVPDVEVRLILLRDVAEAGETFTVHGGDWSALRRVLETIVYDGATCFDGLKRDRAVQEWLLFSDGLVNFGASEPRVQLGQLKAPVHAVLASATADATRLRALSRSHGGELVNLLSLAPEPAVAAVRGLPLRFWGVERDPEAVAQVFPEVGAVVAPEGVTVVGVLHRDAATIRVRVGRSEWDARMIVVPITSGVGAGNLAARAWAAAKINALSLDPERNRDDLRRTSQEFGIVTADTSLIVLETAADYLRFDIAPPEELRSEWKALRRERTSVERKERDEHLDRIADQFTERIKWWETKPAKGKLAAKETRAAGTAPVVGLTASDIQPATAPQPSALVPPMPNGEGQGNFAGGGAPVASTDEEVVVLSPFVVSAPEEHGYAATSTLAGTRIRTELRDIGAAVSVSSSQFLRDTGATNGSNLLRYTPSTEVGGVAAGGATPEARDAIKLQEWTPRAGYLDHLKRVKVSERYAVYLEERTGHQRDAGFYGDVAGYLFAEGETALGLRILSNLAELQLEDAALLRILGHQLLQASRPDLALPLFERVLKIRGEEPQSRRDLALACAAAKQYQRAVDLLCEVVAKPWHDRFPGIELLALGELNEIAATCGERLDLSKVDPRLRRHLPVGLRIVLTWDADNCDIDLWVDDPDGERAIYSHPRTAQGGLLSCDFTGGYGPEEFMLRRPKAGKYTVRINYFGDGRNTALGPVTAQVRLITGYGTPEQKEQQMTVRLEVESKNLEVGSIEIAR